MKGDSRKGKMGIETILLKRISDFILAIAVLILGEVEKI